MTAENGRPDPDAVRALFNPRSIAMVGATEKSGWSHSIFNNLGNLGFDGDLYLVNPRTETVHGRRTYRSLSEIGAPVDVVYVMAPTDAVLPVLREGAALGIRGYVVLTAGFGETGPEGQRKEDELRAFAAEHGLTILGPNGVGYVNATARTTPYALAIPEPLISGPVGVVLQSGALAGAFLTFAHEHNVGLSLLTSVGNETVLTVTDVVEYLIDDPETRVIALFLETIRDPERFANAALRAARAGKPIVALKIGSSELASHAAQAHTGALVGDDAVADAAFRRFGVLRVSSVEDLLNTAALLAAVGSVPGPRIAVVTPSGGAAEIIADRAAEEGLELPGFRPATAARLAGIVPSFATVQNPLDVTGYLAVDPALLGRALDAVAADPGFDAALVLCSNIPKAPPRADWVLKALESLAESVQNAKPPTLVTTTVITDLTEYGRGLLDDAGFPFVAGVDHALTALGAAVRWSRDAAEAVRRQDPAPDPGPPVLFQEPDGVWVEHQAARLLADNGIPVVPSALATTEDEAVAAADRTGYPVVLKAVADGLAHRSDIGGVRVGLSDATEVRHAHRDVCALLRERHLSGIGTLVQPQRRGGVELIFGVVRDPAWGLTVAVGLGGVWVEVLKDSALLLAPVTEADVRRALAELRGKRLLDGARGTEPADVDRLAGVVVQIADLAERLGPRLESLEINPLLVNGGQVEALDALITWR